MITIIAAISRNNVIGVDGKIPWEIPADLQHFKDLTKGNVCVMGRATWESIPEQFRPLSNRLNIVLTSNPNYSLPEGALKAKDEITAIHLAEKTSFAGRDIYFIGGESVYKNAIKLADVLEITHVDIDVDESQYEIVRRFPEIDLSIWKPSTAQWQEQNGFRFKMITYTRLVR